MHSLHGPLLMIDSCHEALILLHFGLRKRYTRMDSLIINRISLRFNNEIECYLNISKSTHFSLVASKATWTRGKLPLESLPLFDEWLKDHNITGEDFLSLDFSDDEKPEQFKVALNSSSLQPFKYKIFLQELGRFFIEEGFYIEPSRYVDFSAYQRSEDVNNLNKVWELYKRLDFKWYAKSEELSFNIVRESTYISRHRETVTTKDKIVDEERQLVYRSFDAIPRRFFASYRVKAPLVKFNYKKRYDELKQFSHQYLFNFRSRFFNIDKSGLKSVEPRDVQRVFSRQNLMTFGGGKTTVNSALGMREYGPFKKIEQANKVQLLFIYQNRDDANNLYLYLRNGLKHFPGLLSYVGVPVTLSGDKRLNYSDATHLPETLEDFLRTEYPVSLYPNTLAIVIGPYKKYESDDEESNAYYKVKKLLLDKGISSQFVSDASIRDQNFHYALPNIAIAILAKFGGIPWKLDNKRYNELVVGFNTRKTAEDTFLGSAVFFDNEGKLGLVRGLPQGNGRDIIRHLREAIQQYTIAVGEPDRLVIHYYKPPPMKDVKRIELLLKDELNLPVPFAIVEINDTKSRMDICFDTEYQMGMPESGLYVRIGRDEYLLFNNSRYQKQPVRRVDEELPIKVKIYFADTGGFHHKELITQIYEFSRLNWKGLKQKSQPVTTTYSKMIADFSAQFGGEIPSNDVAQKTPWFI